MSLTAGDSTFLRKRYDALLAGVRQQRSLLEEAKQRSLLEEAKRRREQFVVPSESCFRS